MATALQTARRARGWSQARAVWELMRLAESKGFKVASATSLKTQLSRWENGYVTPVYYQDLLCDFYKMMPEELRLSAQQPPSDPAAEDDDCAELIAQQEWLRTLDQVDQEAGWEPGTARRQVASRLARLDVGDLQDRASRRRRISQRHIAEVLGDYYRGSRSGETTSHGLYRARIGQDKEILTSVLTYPGWLDLDCPLTASSDQLRLASAPHDSAVPLDPDVTDAAMQRLAEAFAADHRLVDMPLYRLLAVDVKECLIAGSVAVMPFVRYALTMDLLEGELIDALAPGAPAQPGSLLLRDRYLPDVRMYSSLDSESITELVGDAAWSNEGMFAFLQGLRRLSQIGGSRVNIPTIEWKMQ
jgi:transcriptional regulator with XRE-family HTH domain